MSCGTSPTGHRKFCRHCGAGLNLDQVICVKCGAAIKTTTSAPIVGSGATAGTPKSRVVAGILALVCFGPIGSHKYYLGSWGWGLVFTGAAVLTMGLSCIITGIIALIEGISYLVMSDEAFAEKYPPESQAPFRW
jgi:TM2 domain-containing membrane protein YozV